MSVCVYPHIHSYVCIYAYVSMHRGKVRLFRNFRSCTCVCVCMRLCMCVCVCKREREYVRECAYACIPRERVRPFRRFFALVYVRVCVRMRVCMVVCVCVWEREYVRECAYISLCIFMYVCIHVPLCVCVCIYIYIYYEEGCHWKNTPCSYCMCVCVWQPVRMREYSHMGWLWLVGSLKL